MPILRPYRYVCTLTTPWCHAHARRLIWMWTVLYGFPQHLEATSSWSPCSPLCDTLTRLALRALHGLYLVRSVVLQQYAGSPSQHNKFMYHNCHHASSPAAVRLPYVLCAGQVIVRVLTESAAARPNLTGCLTAPHLPGAA